MLSNRELLEIEKARAKNRKLQPGLFMTLEDLRFATNNKVAKYRAKRLACNTLVEIGCSIGAQTIEFAKTCKKVIAVDVDKRKIRYAQLNLKKFKNVELICSDGLKLKLDKADIIFCDPERAPGAKKRVLTEFKPDIHELIKKYSKITKDFCIEIPPQTQEIDIDCEREYVSVDGELNRLNLYLGALKSSETSAVVLPFFARLEGQPNLPQLTSTDISTYLYEINEAVVKAQLIDVLAAMLEKETFLYKKDYKFLTSKDKIDSLFFKNSFKVIANLKNKKDAITELQKNKFGKVILRQNIGPKDYWNERKKYENKLTGNKIAHLFVNKNFYLICEKLSPAQEKS
ncbi:MAG: class I SAM-dependent methyltransferase [archaeon]